MAEQLKTSIVRIRTADGLVVGAGFLVTDRHILTCAHVISQSLGLPDIPVDAPLAAVQLDFPLLTARRTQTARVVYWPPPRSDNCGDIAGLELIADPPLHARPMRLVITNEIRPDPFNVLSFSQMNAGCAIYETGLDRLQRRIESDSAGYSDFLVYQQRLRENIDRSQQYGDTEMRRAERSEIIAGLNDLARDVLDISFNELCELLDQTTSGAPIWDERLSGVVGMAVAADQPLVRNTPAPIPAEALHIARSIIEQERKKGILAYVELSAHADEPSPEESNQPRQSLMKDWGLPPEFSLLEATAHTDRRADAPRPSERAKRQLENILEAITQHPRFVLIGEPGAGKTTTLRRLAWDAAHVRLNDPEAPLPVLLDLSRWGEEETPAEFILTDRICDAAAEALERIGTPEALTAVAAWRRDEKCTAALPGLLAVLRDSDADVRAAAIQALGELGDAAAVANLLELLADTAEPETESWETAEPETESWETALETAFASIGKSYQQRDCDLAAAALERIATPEALAAVAEWRRRDKGKD